MGFSTFYLTKLYPVLLRITMKESESKAYAVEITEAFKRNSDFASFLVFHQLSYKKKKMLYYCRNAVFDQASFSCLFAFVASAYR